MRNPIPEEQVVSFFKEHDSYLLFTHNSPDADTVGSASALVMALRELGKKAVAVNLEGVTQKLKRLIPDDIFAESLPEDMQSYTMVSIDIASKKMLLGMENIPVFDLSIDHHETNSIPCQLLFCHPDYSSTGEIIFELLKAMHSTLTPSIARALYAAISSDSGGFRYDSVRPETMMEVAELMKTGIDFAEINRILFDCKPLSQIALEKIAYENLEIHFDHRFALTTITEEDILRSHATDEDTESLNNIPRQIQGVQISAVIKPKGDIVKCSIRTNEQINAAEFVSRFHGGGHFHAAAFSTTEKSIPEVREMLLHAVQERLASL